MSRSRPVSPLLLDVLWWYLCAILAGAIAVNAGVLMLVGVVERPRAGVLMVGVGAVVVLSTLVFGTPHLAVEADGAHNPDSSREDSLEIRTPVVDGLQVRTGPGTDFEPARSIWQVNEGDRLHVVEDTLGWIRFRLRYFDPDWSGWVDRRYTTSWQVYLEVRRIERVRRGRPR